MDVQDIAPGQDFTEAIEKTLSACDALVVVIGPRWLPLLEERLQRDDYVRYEVSAALRRKITVIPVLVGGGKMPTMKELPASLSDLCLRQAVEVRDSRFEDDIRVLARALSPVGRPPSRRKWLIAAAALPVAAAAAGIAYWKRSPRYEIDGKWIAELQKPNQRPFRVQLDLVVSNDRLDGHVAYPTGNGAIQDGKFENGRLTFFTSHVPNFESEPATIRWTGTIEGDSIRWTVSNRDGVARGIARRQLPQ